MNSKNVFSGSQIVPQNTSDVFQNISDVSANTSDVFRNTSDVFRAMCTVSDFHADTLKDFSFPLQNTPLSYIIFVTLRLHSAVMAVTCRLLTNFYGYKGNTTTAHTHP